VGNVLEDEFERQVESQKPPTVTALAEQGKRRDKYSSMRGSATIPQFRAATEALGKLRDFAEFVANADPLETARAGVLPLIQGNVGLRLAHQPLQ
jgi:hypothetical protein